MKKYVFIGAGPSNIWCILGMLDKGIDGKQITIIEKGNSYYKRKRKEVMNGFAGAGAFSDYKVVYSLTRGGDLIKYTGEEKAKQLITRIKKMIRKFHPNPSKISKSGDKLPKNLNEEISKHFEIILSDCEHIGTDYASKLNKNIYNYLVKNKVKMIFKTEVLDVDFYKKKVCTKKEEYDYDELIIGVGKSGMGFIQKIIDKYNLNVTNKSVQIGVRFESDHKYFEKVTKHFYDFKFQKRYDNNILARTFCVNNGLAFVTKEDTNGLYSYNGHAFKEHKEKRNLTNFGIMLEMTTLKDPLIYTQGFVKEFNRNKTGCYYTASNRKSTVDAVKIKAIEFNNQKKIFEVIFSFIDDLNKIFHFEDDYIIYVPEVKYVTKNIVLDNNDMSLPEFKNVHIIGDSAGARGLFVSKSHGLHLSDFFEK